MKIVHFCPSYVDLDRETGGVSNIVRQLAIHSAGFGLDVSLVCGNREMGRICGPVDRFRDKNVDMSVVYQLANPLLGPVGKLKKLIGELKQPTIAHVHTCFSLFTETSLYHLHRAGIPFVFTPHGKLTSTVMRNRGVLKSGGGHDDGVAYSHQARTRARCARDPGARQAQAAEAPRGQVAKAIFKTVRLEGQGLRTAERRRDRKRSGHWKGLAIRHVRIEWIGCRRATRDRTQDRHGSWGSRDRDHVSQAHQRGTCRRRADKAVALQ